MTTKTEEDTTTAAQDPVAALHCEAADCVKCGRCLSVCPVYNETRRESEVARGKIALIEAATAGDLSLDSKRLQESISRCLLCGACTENCPNLVAGDKIIQEARTLLTPADAPSLALRLGLRHLLPFPKRIKAAKKVGALLQPLFLGKVPPESGLHWRFAPLRKSVPRLIPDLAPQPFLSEKLIRTAPAESAAVALFIGCVSNYLFPRIAESVLRILERQRLSVHIPLVQGCCGLPAFGAGVSDVELRLAQDNIEAFAPSAPAPIVAFCSSCSAHLKHYPLLFEDPVWKARALEFSQRVKDMTEFLVETGFSGKGIKVDEAYRRLTFHDPCHLRRKQGVMNQPRQLIQSLEGVEFVETGKENLCCGSGGSFNLKHYELSLDIFRRRLKPIDQAQVDTVVTTCMGCLLQFQDGLYQEGKATRAKHLGEILAGT